MAHISSWSNSMEQNSSSEGISRSAGLKFPSFNGTLKLTIVLTRARHWFRSWATWI